MIARYLRSLTRIWHLANRPVRRRPLPRAVLLLENLETRDLPAPLAWSAGAALPAPASGLAAVPSGGSLLVLSGPSATSYTLSRPIQAGRRN